MTNAISGQNSGGLSPSVDLQRSLENRLRANLEGLGSPEYGLTWKHWDMPSGQPICALRASGHHISVKDSIGERYGYPTPQVRDGKGAQGRAGIPSGRPTPMAGSKATETYNEAGNTDSSRRTVALAQGIALSGVKPPREHDKGVPLSQQVVGWATPRTADGGKNVRSMEGALREVVRKGAANDLGTTSMLSHAGTEKPGALAPAFSLWLQGFPQEWLKLRAIGNAIVPPLAAEFIKTFMEAVDDIRTSRKSTHDLATD